MQAFDATLGFPGEGPGTQAAQSKASRKRRRRRPDRAPTLTPQSKVSKKRQTPDKAPTNSNKKNKLYVKSLTNVPSRAVQRKIDQQQAYAHNCDLANCIYAHGTRKCCTSLHCQHNFPPTLVHQFRNFYFGLSVGDKKAWKDKRIVQDYKNLVPHPVTGYSGRRVNKFYLDSPDGPALRSYGAGLSMHKPGPQDLVRVCSRFFHFVLDSLNHTYQPGVPTRTYSVSNTRSGPTVSAAKQELILTWLAREAKFSLILPDSDRVVLPWKTKKDTYAAFVKNHPDVAEKDMPEYSHFCYTWRNDPRCSKVILRKWIPFAKCDVCCTLRALKDNTTDRAAKAKLDKSLGEHISFIRRERTSYYQRQRLSISKPEEYLSLIIDEADQKLYDLPHAKVQSKTEAQEWLVPVKVIGVLAHGRGSWAFTHLKNCKSGSNITIEAIHRVLVETLDAEGVLPDKLYVQLDNTTRQCKNRFVLGYLSYLVESGVFKKVVLSFLPKGHTHEDIDQMFSRFALQLRKSDVWSREDLEKVLTESFHDKQGRPVKVRHLDSVTNISDWLDKYVPYSHYKDITAFHQFKFWRRLNGEVAFAVRKTCSLRDAFTGLTEHDNWTRAWVDQVPPPLVLDEIPPAQRFDVQQDRKAQGLVVGERSKEGITLSGLVAKMRKGVLAVEEAYNKTAPDCYAILKLMESPDPLLCAWPEQDIKRLYADYRYRRFQLEILDGDSDGDGKEDAMDLVSAQKYLRGKAGSWYLIKPHKDDKAPFWVGRACMVDWGPENPGDTQLWRGVRMEFWEPKNKAKGNEKSKLYNTSAAKFHKSSEYDLMFDENLEAEIPALDMFPQKKQKDDFGHLTKVGQQIVASWMDRWANPADCEYWDSDEEPLPY